MLTEKLSPSSSLPSGRSMVSSGITSVVPWPCMALPTKVANRPANCASSEPDGSTCPSNHCSMLTKMVAGSAWAASGGRSISTIGVFML